MSGMQMYLFHIKLLRFVLAVYYVWMFLFCLYLTSIFRVNFDGKFKFKSQSYHCAPSLVARRCRWCMPPAVAPRAHRFLPFDLRIYRVPQITLTLSLHLALALASIHIGTFIYIVPALKNYIDKKKRSQERRNVFLYIQIHRRYTLL